MKVRVIKKSLIKSSSSTGLGNNYTFVVDEIEATQIDYNVSSPTNPTYVIHYDDNGTERTVSYSANGFIISIIPYIGT